MTILCYSWWDLWMQENPKFCKVERKVFLTLCSEIIKSLARTFYSLGSYASWRKKGDLWEGETFSGLFMRRRENVNRIQPDWSDYKQNLASFTRTSSLKQQLLIIKSRCSRISQLYQICHDDTANISFHKYIKRELLILASLRTFQIMSFIFLLHITVFM